MATEIAQIDGGADLLLKVLSGERLSASDCLRLWKTRDLTSLGALANLRREAVSGNAVFFRREVHLNYTGLPVPSCPLCNRFASRRLSPGQWERSLELIHPDIVAELHLTAGASPQFGLDALCAIVRRVAALRPSLKVRAFTWSELETAAEREGTTPDQTLEALVEAGLDSLAGGALMDLTPDCPHLVRERIAQLELRAPWVAAAAARGLRCEISWVYGDEDDPQWIIDGLARIRDLQDRWGIFQCFTPLLFQWPSDDVEIPMATGYNQLRAVAVGRLILDNLARVRGSWAALTESMMQVAFWYGADDAGGAVLPGDDLTGTVIGQEQLEELIRGTGRDPIDDLRLTNDD